MGIEKETRGIRKELAVPVYAKYIFIKTYDLIFWAVEL
jgi:hypothetical protein